MHCRTQSDDGQLTLRLSTRDTAAVLTFSTFLAKFYEAWYHEVLRSTLGPPSPTKLGHKQELCLQTVVHWVGRKSRQPAREKFFSCCCPSLMSRVKSRTHCRNGANCTHQCPVTRRLNLPISRGASNETVQLHYNEREKSGVWEFHLQLHRERQK